jgi:hypothetical protein
MPIISIEQLEKEHVEDMAFQNFRTKLNRFLATQFGRERVVIARDHEVRLN